MSENLKPCRCGGEIDPYEDDDGHWYVECRSCGEKTVKPLTDECVEEWWNGRAEQDGTKL